MTKLLSAFIVLGLTVTGFVAGLVAPITVPILQSVTDGPSLRDRCQERVLDGLIQRLAWAEMKAAEYRATQIIDDDTPGIAIERVRQEGMAEALRGEIRRAKTKGCGL